MIKVDFKRTFGTIDRKKLLEKLYQYGIRGGIRMLRSFKK